MAIRDLIKRNGEATRLPVKREEALDLWTESPFRAMEQMMERWNRWFDSLFGSAFSPMPFRGFFEPVMREWETGPVSFVPAINLIETGNEYRLTAELPGIDPKDVEITLNKDTLTIKGEKKHELEDKGSNYYRMERSYGTFRRTIALPEEVDPDKVEATFKHGVLTITLPKRPELQSGARKITVKTEA